MAHATQDVTREQLINDFKVVIADAEALLKASADQGGEKVAELRSKAAHSISVMKERLGDVEHKVVEKTKAAAKATDVYVHENPWKSIGIATGVGLAVGFLLGRR
ncbi:MAG TPA: YqjD family protein [Gammaproteobacteria bacterium]